MPWIISCALLLGFCFYPGTILARHVLQPEFLGISQWINTGGPLTMQSLRGKIVLVDFWTYSCINCIRAAPHLQQLFDTYHSRGLEIIGVHTPEFEFEKQTLNVQAAIRKFNLTYPIALDNEYKTWDAYGSRAWPSVYIIDAKGAVRYQHFGEGAYDEFEKEIQVLLAETRSGIALPSVVPVSPDADFSKIKTPELFLGLSRVAHIGNREQIKPMQAQTFGRPRRVLLNSFYLIGKWSLQKESARLESDTGDVIVRYSASKANMVLAANGDLPTTAEIILDGKPETRETQGTDTRSENNRTLCPIHNARMYNLAHTDYGEHVLEVHFSGRGMKAYTFTFG